MTQVLDKKLPLVVHLRKDYEEFPNHQLVNNQLCRDVPCRRRRVRNWREFAEALKEEVPDIITIYYQELTPVDQQYPERFVNFIQGLIEYIGLNNTEVPAIAIGVDETCTREFINRLKATPGIRGIYWADDQLGEERAIAHRAMLAGHGYWELNIVEQLPKLLPTIVYYNDDHSKTAKCTGEIRKEIECAYTLPSTWKELTAELEAGAEYLAFHIDMIVKSGSTISEFIDAIFTINKFIPQAKPLRVMVLITPTTDIKFVKQLQKTAVSGIGLDMNYYSVDEVRKATKELLAGRTYWPKHILGQLPNSRPTVKKSSNGISLTARQQEVMDLIRHRGLSNKQIAKTLKLSESTVKIHVSAIMRAHGVRNRTQLALSASTGLKA